MKWTAFKKKNFMWWTLALFLASVTLHWIFAWQAYKSEQLQHHMPVEIGGYLTEVLRDTFENWQSEFLQLIWQVAGLSFLFFVGSSQSKEGDDRKEEKLDLLLKKLYENDAQKILKDLEKKYPKE